MRDRFDADYYLTHNEDVIDTIHQRGVDAFAHFMSDGWLEGRDPCAEFSTMYYLQANKDIADAGMNPFVHWVLHGEAEGRPGKADPERAARRFFDNMAPAPRAELEKHFDEAYYLGLNGDVAAAVEGGAMTALEHFMVYGWREGRSPSPHFSVRYYLEQNGDIAESGVNPFHHWIFHGRTEGRHGRDPDGKPERVTQPLSAIDPAHRAALEEAFDTEFYLMRNLDVAEAVMRGETDAFRHFMTHGWTEGRDPSREFSIAHYLGTYQDIANAGINPFQHWVLHGQAEGRSGVPAVKDIDESADIKVDAVPRRDYAEAATMFDADYYLDRYPEVAERGVDPLAHYMLIGWRKGFDPCPEFSTDFYRFCYRDIRQSGANPFLHWLRHGRAEKREALSYVDRMRSQFRPKVSIILPNYNHAPYLPQRIKSIADQTYDNVELFILDDKSPDNSQDVIRQTVADLEIEANLVFNEENSGNVFAQWRKGLSMATGDLIWICESDDFCEPDFLERLVPHFADLSVNMAFGRIQFSDADGGFREGLDGYREGAEAGIWDRSRTRPAAEWFSGAFGVNNVYANVGGGIFRNIPLPDRVWEEARTYRICGDWFLYQHLAGGAQITFEPAAVAYFRQHDKNTSATNFHRMYYYEENIRILSALIDRWGIPRSTRESFLGKVRAQWKHFGMADEHGDFDAHFNTAAVLDGTRSQLHIQLHFLGFHAGGGELFPINLANALHKSGQIVSLLATDMSDINTDMLARLHPGIAIYNAMQMAGAGRADYFASAGVSVVNSHVASADALLANTDPETPMEVPYVVTLHGSYVALDGAPGPIVDWILENVQTWIYTADRNLEFFEERDVVNDVFLKLPNAMPQDDRDAAFTRADLGIPDDALLFTMVARGIKRKGWRASIEAFRALKDRHGVDNAHLILVGEGKSTDHAKGLAAGLDGVHFVGYQSQINGILRMSDVMILPTRFEGESFPLCLIQALQETIPAVATDLGEIANMMRAEEDYAGVLVRYERDSQAFFDAFGHAMAQIADPAERARARAAAKIAAERFDMDRLALRYVDVYKDVMLPLGAAEA
ncbi:MAG: glycosyltransferase [Pseudomonadota bacterium]